MISESLGLLTPCVTRHTSSFMIYDSLGALWLWNPLVTRDSISLMIYESVGAVWLLNPSVNSGSISFMIYDSLGAVWVVECSGHTSQQFVDHLRVPRGCLSCRIHVSPVTAVR